MARLSQQRPRGNLANCTECYKLYAPERRGEPGKNSSYPSTTVKSKKTNYTFYYLSFFKKSLMRKIQSKSRIVESENRNLISWLEQPLVYFEL